MNRELQNNNIALIVVSCDKYQDLWEPFFHLFFKYWPDCPYQIYLTSNTLTYPDERVSPILIGPDSDYSSNLLNIIGQVNKPWIILWFEDCFLTGQLDTKRFVRLISLAQSKDVGYFKLTVDVPVVYTKSKNEEIAPIPKYVKYRSGIGLALYKKETLIKLLKPGETAWEHDKSSRSNLLEDKFYGLSSFLRKNPLIPVINSVIKGHWAYKMKRFFKSEGLDQYINSRPNQSLLSYLYECMYNLRLDVYVFFRKYWYDKPIK